MLSYGHISQDFSGFEGFDKLVDQAEKTVATEGVGVQTRAKIDELDDELCNNLE